VVKKLKIFLFSNNTRYQILFKNLSWILLSDVIIRSLKFSLIPYSSHILGVGQFGTFHYLITLCPIFYVLSDLGLSGLQNREYNKKTISNDRETNTSIYFYTRTISVSLCFLISLVLIFYYLKTIYFKELLLILVITYFDFLKKSYISILNAKKQNEIYSLISIVSNSILVLSGYLVLKTTLSLLPFVFTYLIFQILELITLSLFFKPNFPKLQLFDKKKCAEMLKKSIPFMLTGVIYMIVGISDVLIIKYIENINAVAFYLASLKIVEASTIFYSAYSKSLFPILCSCTSDADKFINLCRKSISTAFLVGVPIMTGGILISEKVIFALFGTSYIQSISVLKILLCSFFLSFLLSIINPALLALNKEITNAKISFFSAMINIAFSIGLIFKYGIVGVAIGTLISGLLDTAFSYRCLHKTINSSIIDYSEIIKIITANVSLFLVVSYLLTTTSNIVFIILTGVFSYIFSLILIKEKITFSVLNKAKRFISAQ
jgi:O-antigen/teichoic acid export membrane protein